MPGSNIKTEIQISVPFLCGLILFLLVDRTGLGGQMVLAALSHEIGHLLAMTVLGRTASEDRIRQFWHPD